MKIIIIGGGIGGLTTAIALQQRGIHAQIYEAAPEIREAGAGLWVAANAINVLERLGIATEIKAVGNQLLYAGLADHKGNSLSEVDFTKIINNYGNGTVAIHRGKLQSILLKNVASQSIFTGKKVENIAHTEGGIQVQFSDGSSEKCDVLIGADGLNSVVRKHLFGVVPLRYSGQTCWRGISKSSLKDTRTTTELWGKKGGLRASYVQVGENEVYWYVTLKEKEGIKISPTLLKSYLLDLVSEFQSDIQNIIQNTETSAILHNDLFDFKPIPQWHKGNIVLVGDAAHATTPNLGQGACQAIEDAYVLAKCLSEKNDPQEAFKAYQNIRFKKAKFVVETSYQLGLLNNIGGAIGYRLRNLVLKSVPKSMSDKQFDYLFKLNY